MSLHRYHSSLERILEFSQSLSLPSEQYQTAKGLVNRLIQHYGLEQTVEMGYKPATLIHATLVHVASPDTFLRFFLSSMYDVLSPNTPKAVDSDTSIIVVLSYFDDFTSWNSERTENFKRALEYFAEYIVEGLLLPLRASSNTTPQPTPSSLSSAQVSTPTGTTQRLSRLRQTCLLRDRHRCVVSRKFDRSEAKARFLLHGNTCVDDDGTQLISEPRDQLRFLEVAHILPRSLTTIGSGDTDLSDSKKNALRILDMFDPGIGYLIDGPKVDSPVNAVTLTLEYHRLFGGFQVYFEPTGQPCQYKIDSTEQEPFLRDPLFPVTRTLALSPNRTIDPPSSRLLGVHRAIAIVMKMSGADEYIEKVLRDMDEIDVKADGSTNFGQFVGLRLDGWLYIESSIKL